MAQKSSQKQSTRNISKKGAAKGSSQKAISEAQAWDLDQILQGQQPSAIIDKIEKDVSEVERSRVRLTASIKPSELRNILLLKDKISEDSARVSNYYELKFYENTTDQQALSEMNRLKQVFTELDNKILFFSLWFMHLDERSASALINAKELSEFKHYLERIRTFKEHTLSEDTEKILNLKSMTGGDAFADLYEIMTSGYTYDFKGKKLTREEVTAYYRSDDPKLRELAYETVLSRFKENSLVLSEIYKNIVLDWYNEDIKIRKYKSPISPRNLGNDVDDKAVEALMNVVKRNAGVLTEYFRIKYQLNQKKGAKYKYSRYHLYAPFKSNLKKKYPYMQSKEYSLETYKMFDQRVHDAAKLIFDRNCVHSHPQKNKRSGAFCMNITNKLPPYILLNHTDELNDLFTMMHELGHGIHDILSQKQINLSQHAGLPMAETASVFGEMLLASRMLAESKDKEEKKVILVHLLDNQYATIVRQAYFVMFEKYAHEKITGALKKEELDEKYHSLLKEQFGDMEVPDVFKHEWNYIPHIHETPFYCYAYAWGNLMVLALYDMYKKEGKPFTDKYVKLLATGGSKSAADTLREIGIDPSSEQFWQRGFNIIKEEIEELKKLG